MSDDEVLKLCDVIRQTSYDIHKYLIEHGLLINFGSPILEIKKYILRAET